MTPTDNCDEFYNQIKNLQIKLDNIREVIKSNSYINSNYAPLDRALKLTHEESEELKSKYLKIK